MKRNKQWNKKKNTKYWEKAKKKIGCNSAWCVVCDSVVAAVHFTFVRGKRERKVQLTAEPATNFRCALVSVARLQLSSRADMTNGFDVVFGMI